MNSLARRQLDLNQTTREDWAAFASHRHRVTELLVNAASGAGRLCVLGAGNCNDLDLPRLAAAFEEVALVDLDQEALTKGTTSQRLEVGDRLRCVGATDVTGALSRIAEWSPSTRLESRDLEALAAGAPIADWPIVARFDVVASTCLLSQLVGSLNHALSDRHPQFLDAVRAIRIGHFRTLASLLRPGGQLAFVSDVVASDTCPELAAASDPDVHRIVANAIKAGNFFTGLNPSVVHGVLKSDPLIAPLFEAVAFIPPWVWQCGRRTYAVYALTATCAGSLSPPGHSL